MPAAHACRVAGALASGLHIEGVTTRIRRSRRSHRRLPPRRTTVVQARWRSRARRASRRPRQSDCRSGAREYQRPSLIGDQLTEQCRAGGRLGPNARPRQSPAKSSAEPEPNAANAILATTAPAHRLAIRSDPMRLIRPPVQKDVTTPTANTAVENIERLGISSCAEGATAPGANSARATSACSHVMAASAGRSAGRPPAGACIMHQGQAGRVPRGGRTHRRRNIHSCS